MQNNKVLVGKKILIGITGSIAAYKMPHFVRLLIKQGAEVKVIATTSALTLVSEVSLSTVSKNEVLSDISNSGAWNNHVDLALWADLMIIAPLSANTLAKLSYGLCDNLLTAVYLSAKCPIYFAPAMDLDMWKHPTTQENIQRLLSFGLKIIPVGDGELASGLVGPGRMAEPEDMLAMVIQHFEASPPISLKYKQAVITAGPTYEYLDPVRFIGNISTGKMGISFAKYLAEAGVAVKLVLGPTNQSIQHPLIDTINVKSAEEMFAAVKNHMDESDLFIMAAAVADYRPKSYSDQKIKKKDQESDDFILHLEKNPDILSYVGHHKNEGQTVIGFALETHDEIANAQSKLERKKADYIVLNSLQDEGAGFGADTNKVTILSEKNGQKSLPLMSKDETAQHVIEYIQSLD